VKILLDECLPIDFRHFPQHDSHTGDWAGLKGRKNRDLLRSAEAAGYDVLLTADHGIPYLQSSTGRRISIIVVRSRTNQLEDLVPLVDAILQTLETIEPGETKLIPPTL
jgi:hypothetical protein